MDTNNALAAVIQRNAFYKRLHYITFASLLLTIGTIGMLVWSIYYLSHHSARALYFPADKAGRLIRVIPLDQPNMSSQEVAAWVVTAIEAAYSYDYVNYHAQLQNAQKYFTDYGWTSYMHALEASNNLIALTERKMVVTARVVDQPTFVKVGLIEGIYAWEFQLHLLLTYVVPPYDDQSKFENPLDIAVVVQRQSMLQSDHGLGIIQLLGNVATTLP